MALVERVLSFQFQLASGTFIGSGGKDTTTLSGLRATAKVIKAGTPSLATAQIAIYGVPLQVIKQLATLGMVYQLIPRNVVTVQAGDAGSSMSTAFQGTVTQAWGDFSGAPDVPFQVVAHTLGAESVIPAAPASYAGASDVAGIMGELAKNMGLTFENNGVDQQLASPYFWGSARDQADQCAQAAGINWFADDATLAIWPKGGSRGGDVPVIAPPPEGAMRGYPTFTADGIALQTIYNPSLKFGGKVRIRSSILPASGGPWAIMKLAHDLSTLQPDGDWFSSVDAFNPKFDQPRLA